MPALARYIIQEWPEASRDAAERLIRAFGAPDDAGPTVLLWDRPGPWRRVTATRCFHRRAFPALGAASVEWVLGYRPPDDRAAAIAAFAAGLLIDRIAGEVSARRATEREAIRDFNLMHEVATGALTPVEAQERREAEDASQRGEGRGPYSERLRFGPIAASGALGAVPDPLGDRIGGRLATRH